MSRPLSPIELRVRKKKYLTIYIYPNKDICNNLSKIVKYKAGGGTRTHSRLITNQLRCLLRHSSLLNYAGFWQISCKPDNPMTISCAAHIQQGYTGYFCSAILCSSPGGTRTRDIMVNSHALYQLSYKRILCTLRLLSTEIKTNPMQNKYHTRYIWKPAKHYTKFPAFLQDAMGGSGLEPETRGFSVLCST